MAMLSGNIDTGLPIRVDCVDDAIVVANVTG